MAQRQYEAATVFNARAVDMRHLWEPSREYKGQPTQKPNYFGSFIVPKTQGQWFSEPALAGVAQACSKFQSIMQMYNYNPASVTWPVVDGDMPTPEGKTSEWAKGHWIFSGSSGNPPNIELVQAGGALVKLTNKVGVKSGDYCMTGVTAAIKQNDPRGVKLYLNAIVFSAPGEEIVFANSVSGAELMQMAQRQGLQVAGFQGAPGFGGAPGGGFAPNQPGQSFGGTPGGFGAGPQPGFQQPPQGGFAPTPGNPAFGAAPGQFQQPAPGGFGAPGQAAGGFAAPGVQGQNPAASQFQPNPGNGNAAYPSNPQYAPNPGNQPQPFGAQPGQTPPNPFGPR